MSKKKLLIGGILIGVIILIGLSLGTIGFMYTKSSAFDHVFANGVYIEDLAIGGLTKEEAKAKLEENISDLTSKQQIVFTNGDVSKAVPLSNLGMTYNIDETIDKAFDIGHHLSLFERYKVAKDGLKENQYFYLDRAIDETIIKQQVNSLAELFYIEPVNATLERVNRTFVTTKEENGAKLDVEATSQKVVDALNKLDSDKEDSLTIEVVTEVISPEFTEASLADCQTLVSSFSTSYNNSDQNRNENLKVAAHKISRTLLPDEIFYLSNQLEPFTEEEGYKNAGTIVNGKIEDSLGGGICQVASTLYNTVLLTDLEVVYRQNHSLAVSYVPLGRDATYNTGSIDFQFKNNTGYPIFIDGYCENNQVIVSIYGHKSMKTDYTIKFESVVTEEIPAPETKYEDDPTLEVGKEVVDVRALDGKRVSLYKLYYDGDKLVNKVLVNTSYYRPRAAIIKKGTKKPASDNNSSTKPVGTLPSDDVAQNPTPPKEENNASQPAPPSVDSSPTPVAPTLPEVSEDEQPLEDDFFAIQG